ncbi:MAG: TrbI/VirB10 family protein [Gammaproteobacteria bacterium]|nr:TrbI/VirB10 family protein [Gammaproteobacteria bacterium]
MRTSITLLCLLSFPLSPTLAEEVISYEQYSNRIGSGQKKIDYSGELIKHSELHEFIVDRKDAHDGIGEGLNKAVSGVKKNKAGALKDKVSIDKRGDSSVVTGRVGKDKNHDEGGREESNVLVGGQGEMSRMREELAQLRADKKPVSKSKKEKPRYRFIPPSLRGQSVSVSNKRQIITPRKIIEFGIPIGSKIKLRLSSSASNVQPGFIQFTVDEDVVGEKKILTKGSTIFCLGDGVIGSSRLFTTSVKGITQDGRVEFRLSGNVYGEDDKAGLMARVVSDGHGLARAKDAGVAALGAGLIGMVPGADVTTGAGKAAANSALRENSQKNDARHGRPNFVLDASPQLAVLHVEETF